MFGVFNTILKFEDNLQLLQGLLIYGSHTVVHHRAAYQKYQNEKVSIILDGLLARPDTLAINQQVVNILPCFFACYSDGCCQYI